MKGFIVFMGLLLETLFFVALVGFSVYLGWLSWAERDVYLLIAAVATVLVAGLLLVLVSTMRVAERVRKIENAVQNKAVVPTMTSGSVTRAVKRAMRQTGLAVQKPVASPVPVQVPPQPTSKPEPGEAGINASTSTGEPAVAATQAVEPPIERIADKKQKPTVSEVVKAVVKEVVNQETKTRIDNIIAGHDGDGASHLTTDEILAKVCPKCGVKGQMIKFGMREGRQKWHCQSCRKTTVDTQKKVGVGV